MSDEIDFYEIVFAQSDDPKDNWPSGFGYVAGKSGNYPGSLLAVMLFSRFETVMVHAASVTRTGLKVDPSTTRSGDRIRIS